MNRIRPFLSRRNTIVYSCDLWNSRVFDNDVRENITGTIDKETVRGHGYNKTSGTLPDPHPTSLFFVCLPSSRPISSSDSHHSG